MDGIESVDQFKIWYLSKHLKIATMAITLSTNDEGIKLQVKENIRKYLKSDKINDIAIEISESPTSTEYSTKE